MALDFVGREHVGPVRRQRNGGIGAAFAAAVEPDDERVRALVLFRSEMRVVQLDRAVVLVFVRGGSELEPIDQRARVLIHLRRDQALDIADRRSLRDRVFVPGPGVELASGLRIGRIVQRLAEGHGGPDLRNERRVTPRLHRIAFGVGDVGLRHLQLAFLDQRLLQPRVAAPDRDAEAVGVDRPRRNLGPEIHDQLRRRGTPVHDFVDAVVRGGLGLRLNWQPCANQRGHGRAGRQSGTSTHRPSLLALVNALQAIALRGEDAATGWWLQPRFGGGSAYVCVSRRAEPDGLWDD